MFFNVLIIPTVTEEKLMEICRKIWNNKSKNLNVIQNKLAIKKKSNWVMNVFERYLVKCEVPS